MQRIVILIFDGFQLLDVAGPVAALEAAEQCRPGSYRVELRARNGDCVESSSGVVMRAERLGRTSGVHTLIVAGGDGTRQASRCKQTLGFIQRCHQRGVRIASVCSGTYLLAAAGLLEGKRATTHWCVTSDFQRRFPNVRLDVDKIYVRDGNLWSSAGVSAGIDLTLAMITADVGESIARQVAQQLVVYYQRPGGQSQFSALLELTEGAGPFEGLLDFIRSHLTAVLNVEQLARKVGMSPRNFSRRFTEQVGMSPGQVVQRVRTESARAALESGASSVVQVATECGFGDPERMRRSFLRLYGLPPSSFVRR